MDCRQLELWCDCRPLNIEILTPLATLAWRKIKQFISQVIYLIIRSAQIFI